MSALKPKLLSVSSACLSVLILTLFFAKVWHHQGLRFDGDEPHYLVMTRNIIDNGNLDLSHIYATPSEYRDIFPGVLDPHLSLGQDKPPARYSLHGAGIPILLVPVMKYFGLEGVVKFMCFWAALVCVLAWFWVKRLTKDYVAATLSVATLTLSISFLSLVGHVFPDFMIAALLLIAALELHKPKLVWADFLLLSVVIGILPWIHVKTIFFVAAIGLMALWHWYKQFKSSPVDWLNLALLLIPAGILLLGYEASLMHWYNTLLPTKAFASSGQLFQISPATYFAAGMFDVTKGLLIANPAFVFILAGLPLWWKQDRRSILIAAALILPTLLLQSTFGDWWGGWSPTGRYWLEFIPLLLPALGYSLALISNWIWRSFFLLALLVQLKFTHIYLQAMMTWVLPGSANPVLAWLHTHGAPDASHWLPNFGHPVDGRDWLLTLTYATGLILIAIWTTWLADGTAKQPKKRRRAKS